MDRIGIPATLGVLVEGGWEGYGIYRLDVCCVREQEGAGILISIKSEICGGAMCD